MNLDLCWLLLRLSFFFQHIFVRFIIMTCNYLIYFELNLIFAVRKSLFFIYIVFSLIFMTQQKIKTQLFIIADFQPFIFTPPNGIFFFNLEQFRKKGFISLRSTFS